MQCVLLKVLDINKSHHPIHHPFLRDVLKHSGVNGLDFSQSHRPLSAFIFSRLTLPRMVVVTPKNVASNPYNCYSGSLVITIIVKGLRAPTVTSGSITQFPVTSARTLQVGKKPGI